MTWSTPPSTESQNRFVLKFWKKSDATSSGPYSNPSQTVFVKLWMPSMGHGSSPVSTNHLQDSSHQDLTGQFEASNVYFIMPGAWDIHIQLKDGSTVAEESVLPIKL